jgi:Winged helix DNA-binding domain
MAVRVSANDILSLRMRAQFIDPVGQNGVAGGVRSLLALQAQDFAQALWAIGLRAHGSTRTDVLAALEAGDVVRTLPMRGTLHFVAAEDLRWMLSATARRTLQSAATRFRALGLDQQTLDLTESITREALAGNRSLSRDEFMKTLESNGVSPDGQRGYHIIFYLTQLSLVCWGPPRGTQQALVLVDDWIKPTPTLPREAALREFARRYFAGHGPATELDFAWWTKLPLADVRAAIASLGSELTELTLDSTTYWITTGSADDAASSRLGAGIHLLPGFDEYLLGYRDRSLPLPAEHSQRIVPGNNGIFLPMILKRGRVVGTWRRTPKSKTSAIEAASFAEATPAAHASFARASSSYARFAGG